MKYLTGEEILVIHSEIIDKTGGLHGIRDINLFVSILEKPKSKFGGNELHKSVFAKAAIYFESFAKYHVFIDGNKRIAFAASVRFLSLNGYEFTATNKQVESFIIKAATRKLNMSKITQWLKEYAKKLT
jgi:death on curing protein